MFHLRRTVVYVQAIAVIASTFLLTGCPGATSNQPAQPPAARIEIKGIVTDGVHTGPQSINAKGVSGLTRNTLTTATGEYTLSLTDLTEPYLLANTLSTSSGTDPDFVMLTTVATKPGVANVTPLTTLLTSQLLGVSPGDAITSFNSSGTVHTELITDANIQAAQADLTAYLQDVVGVQVKSGTASFVESPLTPAAGDPMFDTIVALNAKLAANSSSLAALAARIATGVRACVTEEVDVMLNGQKKKFCPVNKSATPEDNDTTILDYVFQNIANEMLTLKIRNETVLSGEYVTTGGGTYTCTDAGCAGITLGTPADDLTRKITFASTSLSGDGGVATLDGSVIGAIPGITLPTLPCADNRFFVIFGDRSVIADCVAANDPFGLGGTFGGGAGPGRFNWGFANGSGTPLPTMPRMEIVVDGSTPDQSIVSVFYTDFDPDTGQVRSIYACQLTACNGVVISPATINTSVGFPIEIRNITLNNTILSGLNPDGASTGKTVTVRASFTTLRDPSQVAAYPALAPCDPSADTIATVAYQANFNICIPPNDLVNGFIYRTTYDQGNGDLELYLVNDSFDQVMVFLHNDALVSATVVPSSTGENFSCAADCAGISVSAPDGTGQRTLTFTGAVLRQVQSFPLPGDRTLTLTSGAMVVPPP